VAVDASDQDQSAFCTTFDATFRLLLEGRNSSAHEGAYARNVTRHAVDLALAIEDALQLEMEMIEHFMVPDPVRAHLWEPLGHLRQRMLRNAFSFLPVWVAGEDAWRLVADVDLARFLRNVSSTNERRMRLRMELQRAIEQCAGSSAAAESKNGVILRETKCVPPHADGRAVAQHMTDVPVLVINEHNPQQLLGIVTAFDLL
jgi:hypothetical protein